MDFTSAGISSVQENWKKPELPSKDQHDETNRAKDEVDTLV